MIYSAISEPRFVLIVTEVKDKIDEEQLKQKRRYDQNRKPGHIYNVGDLVGITRICFNNDGRSKKFMGSYVGPYRVSKVLGRDRYKVTPVPGMTSTQAKRLTIVAVDRMKPWIHIDALEVNEQDSASDVGDDY